MSQIEAYKQFKEQHIHSIKALAVRLGHLSDDTHWALVDEMKDALASSSANESSDDAADQDAAIASAEEWVASNCSSGSVEEDVAMALWLRGADDGERYLISESALAKSESALAKAVAELREIALDDARLTRENGVSLNPFSTSGGRTLWQQGWDGVRPANLVDTSINWRFWERGRQAKIVSEESSDLPDGALAPTERPRG